MNKPTSDIYIATTFIFITDFGLKEKMHLNIYKIDSIFLLMFK